MRVDRVMTRLAGMVLVAGLAIPALAGKVKLVDAPDTVPLKPCCDGDLSVYRDFGEKDGINLLMQDFMRDLLADDRTRPFFAKVDQAHTVQMLTEQFCYAMGGPCTYSGHTMKESHRGLGIKREHFDALVEVLQKAMDRRRIPVRAQNKVLAVFAPMYRDIEGPKF